MMANTKKWLAIFLILIIVGEIAAEHLWKNDISGEESSSESSHKNSKNKSEKSSRSSSDKSSKTSSKDSTKKSKSNSSSSGSHSHSSKSSSKHSKSHSSSSEQNSASRENSYETYPPTAAPATTLKPKTASPTTSKPITTSVRTTRKPTTAAATTTTTTPHPARTDAPTTTKTPTAARPTTAAPTTAAPMTAAPTTAAATTTAPKNEEFTRQDLAALQQSFQDFINANPERIPKLVQLSFHDCFGPDGCDGCINPNDGANRGLVGLFAEITDMHQRMASKISLADFIAVLGIETVKISSGNSRFATEPIHVPFHKGRRTCTDSSRSPSLPPGFITNGLQLLQDEFGLTLREAVALMGSHSLGGANPQISGFNGTWDVTPLVLDNGYFFEMKFVNWAPERMNTARSTQWSPVPPDGPDSLLMLHVDMALRKRFTTSRNFHVPSCSSMTECPDNNNIVPFINEFTDLDTGLKSFHDEFARAYLKMINKSRAPLVAME